MRERERQTQRHRKIVTKESQRKTDRITSRQRERKRQTNRQREADRQTD